MTTHHPINFSPFAVNVLDWVDKPGLCTPTGKLITVGRSGMSFTVTLSSWTDDPESGRPAMQLYIADSNTQASYILNSMQAGVMA